MCPGRGAGACQRLHDPAKVAVCPQWLQAACTTPNCPLQHKVWDEGHGRGAVILGWRAITLGEGGPTAVPTSPFKQTKAGAA